MASILEVAGKWRAQVRKHGVSKAKTFKTRDEAQRWAESLEQEIAPTVEMLSDVEYEFGQPKKRSSLDGLPGTHAEKMRERSRWYSMLARCYNTAHNAYKTYGGAGVTVCDRWQTFANFYADMGPAPDGMSLDRIDPFGDYSPENCRWATDAQQATNKRPLSPQQKQGRLKKSRARTMMRGAVAKEFLALEQKAKERGLI